VDVGFSDSQLELRAAVRDVLTAECPPGVLREVAADPERWRPLWKTVTDLGWPALAYLDGDSGTGVVELVAVLEECGAAAAPVPLLSSALAAGALRAAGADAAPYVEELANGTVGALGVGAPGDRGLRPALTWDGETLTGTTGPVAEAPRAELLVLLAAAAEGTVAAVVRPTHVDLLPQDAIDPGRPVAEAAVDTVPETVLPVAWPDVLAVPLTAAAAELVGVARRLLDLGVAHALGREQFGKPIGSFQGLKHRLADCYVLVERARSLTYAAAMAVEDPDAEPDLRWRSALLAKAAASEAAVETARAAVQVHGAMGMTWEHDVHLYLRRAWSSAALLGESRALYAEAAALLLGRS
jgi:alkylation response protein AidB-like acyl-CoA dehydrogenase